MLSNDAFRPGAPTFAISAPISAPASGVTPAGGTTPISGGDCTVLVGNPGPNDVWMGYGGSAGQAQTNAVAPVPGTPQTALYIPHGSVQSFHLTWNTFLSFLAITAAQTVYVTAGDGI